MESFKVKIISRLGKNRESKIINKSKALDSFIFNALNFIKYVCLGYTLNEYEIVIIIYSFKVYFCKNK